MTAITRFNVRDEVWFYDDSRRLTRGTIVEIDIQVTPGRRKAAPPKVQIDYSMTSKEARHRGRGRHWHPEDEVFASALLARAWLR